MKFSIAAIAITVAIGTHAEPREFSQSGKLKIDSSAERNATLHVACSPDPNGGALSIELNVPEAYKLKDFDYDDFEGPDAAASTQTLSALTWHAASAADTSITSTAAGWYLDDTFNFGINQLSHQRREPARLLNAIRDEAGQLTWTQTGFDNPKHQLIARFDFNAAAAQQLHQSVAECLPQNMPMRK